MVTGGGYGSFKNGSKRGGRGDRLRSKDGDGSESNDVKFRDYSPEMANINQHN